MYTTQYTYPRPSRSSVDGRVSPVAARPLTLLPEVQCADGLCRVASGRKCVNYTCTHRRAKSQNIFLRKFAKKRAWKPLRTGSAIELSLLEARRPSKAGRTWWPQVTRSDWFAGVWRGAEAARVRNAAHHRMRARARTHTHTHTHTHAHTQSRRVRDAAWVRHKRASTHGSSFDPTSVERGCCGLPRTRCVPSVTSHLPCQPTGDAVTHLRRHTRTRPTQVEVRGILERRHGSAASTLRRRRTPGASNMHFPRRTSASMLARSRQRQPRHVRTAPGS